MRFYRRNKRRWKTTNEYEHRWRLGWTKRFDIKYIRAKGLFYGMAVLSMEEGAFGLVLCGVKAILQTDDSPEHVFAAEIKQLCMLVSLNGLERVVCSSDWLIDPYSVIKYWSTQGFVMGPHGLCSVIACVYEPTLPLALSKTRHLLRVLSCEMKMFAVAEKIVYFLWSLMRVGSRMNDIIIDDLITRTCGDDIEFSSTPILHDPEYMLWLVIKVAEIVVKNKLYYLDELPNYIEKYVKGSWIMKSSQCLIIGAVGGIMLGVQGVEVPYENNRKLWLSLMNHLPSESHSTTQCYN